MAAVIAHAVVSPGLADRPAARLAPLVWLGRISYGVYLWHWPLFQFVTAERTGLTGVALLAVPVRGAPLAVAIGSYLLVERPIRTGPAAAPAGARRWPARRSRGRGRGRRVRHGATAPRSAAASLALDAAAPGGRRTPAAPPLRRPPVRRPGPQARGQPRIAFFGDSVSWTLGTYLPAQPSLTVSVRAVQGCGIARLPELRYLGEPHTNYPGCDTGTSAGAGAYAPTTPTWR